MGRVNDLEEGAPRNRLDTRPARPYPFMFLVSLNFLVILGLKRSFRAVGTNSIPSFVVGSAIARALLGFVVLTSHVTTCPTLSCLKHKDGHFKCVLVSILRQNLLLLSLARLRTLSFICLCYIGQSWKDFSRKKYTRDEYSRLVYSLSSILLIVRCETTGSSGGSNAWYVASALVAGACPSEVEHHTARRCDHGSCLQRFAVLSFLSVPSAALIACVTDPQHVRYIGIFYGFDLQTCVLVLLHAFISFIQHVLPGACYNEVMSDLAILILPFTLLEDPLQSTAMLVALTLSLVAFAFLRLRVRRADSQISYVRGRQESKSTLFDFVRIFVLGMSILCCTHISSATVSTGRVSVCIPAIPKDLSNRNGPFLKTLLSIKYQTRRPLEVVIGLSESTTPATEKILNMYKGVIAPVPLRIHSIPGKGSVGTNRNSASSVARGKIFSFFDADGDLMHPRRIELIEDSFERFPDTEIIVHSFTAEDILSQQPMLPHYVHATFLCRVNSERMRQGKGRHEWILPEIHHGHLSITRELFERKAFDVDFFGQEDSKYVNSVLGHESLTHSCKDDKSVIFINETLSLGYIPRSSKYSHEASFSG